MNPLKIVPLLACSMLLALCFAGCSYDDPEKIFSGPIEDITAEKLAQGNQAIYFDDPTVTIFYKRVDNNGKRVGKWSKDWPDDRERIQVGPNGTTPYKLIFTNGKAYIVRDYKLSLFGEDLSFVEKIWFQYRSKYAGKKLGYACRWDYDKGANKLIFEFNEYKVEKADISGFTLSFESSPESEERFKVAYHFVHQFYRKTLSNAQLSDYRLFDSRKELYLAMLQIMRAECGDIFIGYGERYNLAVVEDNVMNDRDPSAGAYISSSDKK